MAAMREFTHPVRIDPWPAGGITFRVAAETGDRRLLAERLGLEALERFEVAGRIDRSGGRLLLAGRLLAEVVQTCVVSLEPFAERIEEPVRLVLEPAADPADAALDPDEMDVVPIAGTHLDLGHILYEELALRLDPHPRAPGASLDALEAPLDRAAASGDDWRARLAEQRQARAG